jgi:UDP-glucuronate 4-epimerase
MSQSAKVRKILVTGAAGFIGFHLAEHLLKIGDHVTGFDNLNDYYDPTLKHARLKLLQAYDSFEFVDGDLKDREVVNDVFEKGNFDFVINLAAQAGVRHSIEKPYTYLDANLTGFLNILESCRKFQPRHLIFASSSSVYGANKKMPMSVHDNVDHPLALYAATKKANELMAHAYANLYALPVTGLRFFSVYGPFGRPDMVLYLFTKAILERQPIKVFNFGRMKRDFTYVADVVQGIDRLLEKIPLRNNHWDALDPDPSTSMAPYRVLNIGGSKPIELQKFIEILEKMLGKKAIKNFLPMQDGDVAEAIADVQDFKDIAGFVPDTPIEVGIERFVTWYKEYYQK